MFGHNFKYSFKVLFRNRVLLFWTFLFPILLGTFFSMAFSSIEQKERLDIISIGVIESQDYEHNTVMKEAINLLSREGEEQLFELTCGNEEKITTSLEQGEIAGYLFFVGDEVNIVVNQSGIEETVLRFVVDEIKGRKKTIEILIEQRVQEEILKGNYEVMIDEVTNEVKSLVDRSSSNIQDVSPKHMSYTMIEYYSLIAMACLYSSMISMFITNYKLANVKAVGKRIVVSPHSKFSGLCGSLIASYVVGAIGMILLFLYTIFVLNVDYGNNLFLVALLASIGLLAGQMFGMAVSVLIKANENTKTGVLVALSMLGSFFSGMMGITMKYVIDTYLPLINLLNPVAMITDGLYSLYYYDTFSRYTFNLFCLFIFSCVMILISFRGLRRQKYDSI